MGRLYAHYILYKMEKTIKYSLGSETVGYASGGSCMPLLLYRWPSGSNLGVSERWQWLKGPVMGGHVFEMNPAFQVPSSHFKDLQVG